MGIRRKSLVAWMLVTTGFLAGPAFPAEISGWIKSKPCVVFDSASKEAKVVGKIQQKAAFTAEETGEEWLKLLFAPVRDPRTGEYIELKEGYIQKRDTTAIDPCKW